MPRIEPLDPETAPDSSREMLQTVRERMGMIPNVLATLAHSPPALQGYLQLKEALAGGRFSEAEQEQINLAVSQTNQCDYCLAAHRTVGGQLGLDEEAIRLARAGQADDQRLRAALTFVQKLVEKRGWADDEDLREAREAGLNDPEIIELIAHVTLNTLTNYTNHVADTELDFPSAEAPP